MKVLTGSLRGQKILYDAAKDLRPTSDKARQAMFDMLQGELEGRRVIDLFSGTGALGFEALSQGASEVVFVEQEEWRCRRITENLTRYKASGRAQVCRDSVLTWLGRQARAGSPYDLIFLDPPYDVGLAAETLKLISGGGVLRTGGFVVLECRRKEDMPESCGILSTVRNKRYGQTKVMVYAARPGV